MENESNVFIENKELLWEKVDEGVQRKIIAYDKQLMVVKVEFENGAVGSLHSHPHTQISYIESGIFEVEINGSKKILTTGDAFFVPSNAVHAVVCLAAGILIDVFSPMREDFLK